MKVEIRKHDLIKLIPESDSDYALIGLWKDKQPHIAGTGYKDGSYFELSIGFKAEEKFGNEQVTK